MKPRQAQQAGMMTYKQAVQTCIIKFRVTQRIEPKNQRIESPDAED